MKATKLVAAAALAVSGMAFTGCDRNDTATNNPGKPAGETVGDKINRGIDKAGNAVGNATDKTVDAAQKAGQKIQGTVDRHTDGNARNGEVGPSREEAFDVVGQVAEAAFSTNPVENIRERLVDADRNRIGAAEQDANGALSNLLTQFRSDWKAKYNQEFDVTDEKTAFKAFTYTQGETPRGAAGVDVDVDVDRKVGGGATAEVDVDEKSGVDSPDTNAADTNRNDPGREMASLRIPASHGAADLTVPMIHEAGGWKIDAPDTLTAEKLRSNLAAHLQAVHAMKDKWPADVNEAQAAVAHHVLMAVMDKPAK